MREKNEEEKEKKTSMDAASEELERRSRYLSSLIQRTKLRTESDSEQEVGRKKKEKLRTEIDSEKELGSQKEKLRTEQEVGRKKEKVRTESDSEQEMSRKKKEKVVVGLEEMDGMEEFMKKIRVRAADMAPALQRRAFRCAREVFGTMNKLESKKLALALKKEFDGAYGPAWHCIVGTSFGSYVTHSLGGFLYFSIDKVYVLLFRTAVEPLSH